jgi:hypothetical protein
MRVRSTPPKAFPLRYGGREPPPAGSRILLTIQVALSVVLVAGTGLMIRSVVRLGAVDFGFDPDRLLLITGALPPEVTPQQANATMDDLLKAIRVLPGVRQTAAVYRAPLQGPIGLDGQLLVEGDPLERESYARHPEINDESVTPGYFSTMGIRIVAVAEGERGSVPRERGSEKGRYVATRQGLQPRAR